METRQITQIKIWKLIMNPMTTNTEHNQLLVISDDRQKLLDWYKLQFADEPYFSVGENYFPAKGDFPVQHDLHHRYYKVFKQGTPLEWFNPIDNEDIPNRYGQGISFEWVNEDMLENSSIPRI